MQIFVIVTVAGWLSIATATAQSTNKPANPPSAPSQPGMPGMDLSQQSADHDTKSMPGMKMDGGTVQSQPQLIPGTNLGGTKEAPELLKDVVARPARRLAEFLNLADQNNPTLKQAAAVVRRSEAQARQAGLYPNPSAGYQGEQIRGGSYGGGEQGAYIAQTIVLGGKLALRRDIYEQQKKSDEAAAFAQTYRVHNDVARAFYKTLAAQETVIARRRLLKLSLDAVETAHQLANVGQADAPDLLQSEVEDEQTKIDYETAQRDFLKGFKVLAAITGVPELPASPLEGAFDAPPEIDTDQIVATILQSSPVVAQAKQEVAIAEAKLKDARREAIPDLQLKAGEQYNFESITPLAQKAVGPQSFASAGVDIPLWNRNQGNKQAAEADIERAHRELQRVQLSLRQQAEPLLQEYLTSKDEAERYRAEMIPRAARAYELYLKKYREMAMAYPQVLVSQRTLFQLQVSYIAALSSVWQNAIALQNYTLQGGLDTPATTGTPATTINLPGSAAGSGAP
jgi:outer membrane protein, heavy metal efflux system